VDVEELSCPPAPPDPLSFPPPHPRRKPTQTRAHPVFIGPPRLDLHGYTERRDLTRPRRANPPASEMNARDRAMVVGSRRTVSLVKGFIRSPTCACTARGCAQRPRSSAPSLSWAAPVSSVRRSPRRSTRR